MRPKIRALVLAAGYGTRLRPLTDRTPKPLIPIFGSTILEHSLAELEAVGCEAAAINLHYHGSQIRARLGDRYGEMALTYSEEPILRGTLGAFAPLKNFFAEADLILAINGDSLCRWPLKKLVRKHLARNDSNEAVSATLLFSRRADPANYGGGVAIDTKKKEVVTFEKEASGLSESESVADSGPREGSLKRMVFAGAHALSPDLLSGVPERVPCSTVGDLYQPLLQAGGRLGAVVTRRRWHDLGTPRRLLSGALDSARGALPWSKSKIAPSVSIGRGARLRRVVVEPGVEVATRAKILDSLVLPEARIGEGAVIIDAIIGPGAEIPAGAWIEGGIVTRSQDTETVSPSSSIIGDFVYTQFSETSSPAPRERKSSDRESR